MRSLIERKASNVVAIVVICGNDAFSTISTGISAGNPWSISVLAIEAACPAAMYKTAVSASQALRIQSLASSPVAHARRNKRNVAAHAAPRQRDLEIGAGGERRSHAGDDFASDACSLQRIDFFLGAPKQHRIAAFKPHDYCMLVCRIDQALVDETLQRRMLAATLADGDFFRALCQRERLRMHQRVVKHDVCAGEQARRAYGHASRARRARRQPGALCRSEHSSN